MRNECATVRCRRVNLSGLCALIHIQAPPSTPHPPSYPILPGNSSLLQQEVDQLRRMLKQGANWGSVSQMMSFISDRAAQVASVSKAPTAPAPGDADGRRPASPLASRLLRTLTPSKTRLGRGRSSEEPELDGVALEAARNLDRQALSAELDVPVLQQLGPLARVEPRDVVQLLERMVRARGCGFVLGGRWSGCDCGAIKSMKQHNLSCCICPYDLADASMPTQAGPVAASGAPHHHGGSRGADARSPAGDPACALPAPDANASQPGEVTTRVHVSKEAACHVSACTWSRGTV